MNATDIVDTRGGIPVCASCGEPLMEHVGMQVLCRESAEQQAEIEKLRAGFRLCLYQLPIVQGVNSMDIDAEMERYCKQAAKVGK